LLVFHSPTDVTVGIENASRIFGAAKHPKSFVSLSGADHLLSKASDAVYVANVIGAWVGRYLDKPEIMTEAEVETGRVLVTGDACRQIPAGDIDGATSLAGRRAG
jgi:putative redox protein